MQKGVHASEKGNISDDDKVDDDATQLVLSKIKDADHEISEAEDALSEAKDKMENWMEGEPTMADEFKE
jgi:hypothetical protein